MADPITGGNYELVVGGTLDHRWSEWFDGFDVTDEGDTTRLHGFVPDQAALHGLLAQLRDVGIPILDVHRIPDSVRGKLE